MENKKTKLTISGSSKKTFKKFDSSKTQGKKTVIIDNQKNKVFNKGNFNKTSSFKSSVNNFKKSPSLRPSTSSTISDFERRKLAEQRATKRLKGDLENKEKKSKPESKKRELKLTVSRALSDEIETRERSLASDELTGGFDIVKGERVKIQGYLEDFALSKAEADELIMSARKIVYKDWGMRNGKQKNKTYYFWQSQKVI